MYGKGESAVEAVRGISLTIFKGELFGFLGPNGAGKTTSLRIMVGLLEQTKGEVQILGMTPKERRARNELKSKIGIIAGGGQFPYLFAEAARKAGRQVVIIGHKGETHPELEKISDSFYWIKLGQLGKILKYLRKSSLSSACSIFLAR